MSNQFTRSIPWFGIFLLILGTALLLNNLQIITFGWVRILSVAFAIYGAGKLVSGFRHRIGGTVFWGSMIFFFAAFFFLRSVHVIDSRSEVVVASTLLILGFSFLLLYLVDVREIVPLIFALTCLILGAGVVMVSTGRMEYEDFFRVVRRYWPILLILLGLGLLVRAKGRAHG